METGPTEPMVPVCPAQQQVGEGEIGSKNKGPFLLTHQTQMELTWQQKVLSCPSKRVDAITLHPSRSPEKFKCKGFS